MLRAFRPLRADRDAFGREMYDCHFGQRRLPEIVERDDGYISAWSQSGTYFAAFDDWPECEKRAMEFVRGKVLDIGCGAGRHCLYLQDEGLDVLGVDISPLAIEVCKARGVRHTKVMSMSQLTWRMGIFDTILMLGDNFGLVGSVKRGTWLLRRFKGMTGSTGRILAGCNNPYKTTNPVHLEYHEMNRKRGRMPGQIRIRIRYQKCMSEWFDNLLLSPEEMSDLVEGTGWSVNTFIEDKGSLYVAILDKRD